MYRVIEVARMLGVSKVTIYKKVNKNKKQLKNHIHSRSNITYIDDIGVEIIKKTLEVASTNLSGISLESDELEKSYLQDLSNIIEFLNQQLQIKKVQVSKKDEIIDAYKSILKSNRGKLQYLESKFNQVN